MPLSQLLNWRLHLLVVLLSLLSEWIGIVKIPLGPGTLLLLPLFYAFVLGSCSTRTCSPEPSDSCPRASARRLPR